MKPFQNKFKATILVVFTLLLNTSLSAQCYKSNLDVGKQQYNSGKYQTALATFQKSLKCPDAKGGSEANQWITRCKSKIAEQKNVSDNKKQPNSNYTESTSGVNIDMVLIKGGTFMMGSPSSEVDRGDDEYKHSVSLSDFYMGKDEVTFEQYDKFCDATGREKPSDAGWGRGNRPVINVSWNDAVAYCEWLSKKSGKIYRLPTEAEWEYACRASSSAKSTPFNTGNNLTTSQANFDGNYPYNGNSKGTYKEKTMPVGSYSPNAWGFYDMHGNVWEWCSDWYSANYYKSSPQNNPKGSTTDQSFRVIRGGSWSNSAKSCRSACRGSIITNRRYIFIGFRLVCKP